MWLVALGVVMIALGLAGLRYAPEMIEAQREQGMEPVASDEIDDEDRILVTRAMSVVFTVIGLFIVAYSLSG